jgi:hypothetical protein
MISFFVIYLTTISTAQVICHRTKEVEYEKTKKYHRSVHRHTFKNRYQRENDLVKDENGDLLAYYQSTSNGWKNCVYQQDMYVHKQKYNVTFLFYGYET